LKEKKKVREREKRDECGERDGAKRQRDSEDATHTLKFLKDNKRDEPESEKRRMREKQKTETH
jgi:hypothetical protein